eukprot:5517662-Amphidinium_carterae.1
MVCQKRTVALRLDVSPTVLNYSKRDFAKCQCFGDVVELLMVAVVFTREREGKKPPLATIVVVIERAHTIPHGQSHKVETRTTLSIEKGRPQGAAKQTSCTNLQETHMEQQRIRLRSDMASLLANHEINIEKMLLVQGELSPKATWMLPASTKWKNIP